jgi:hypothetical protein
MQTKKKRKNPQQGCTRMAIIGQCICCVVRELHPAYCNAVYVLLAAARLMTNNNNKLINRHFEYMSFVSDSQDSVICTVTRRCTGQSRARILAGTRDFSLSKTSRPALGPTQPPIQQVPRALSSGIKRPGCEANHSLPSSNIKNEWSYTSNPVCLHGMYRDTLTLCHF